MKIALLCSGMGNVLRGHEIFVSGIYKLLKNDLNIWLLKGGGGKKEREIVLNHIPRYSSCLDNIHVIASKKWQNAVEEEQRQEIEFKTFAYSALATLLNDDFDIIHCTEKEVCNIIYENRLLFKKIPKIVFSNGGAISRKYLPKCDFVQEHSQYNFNRSAKNKATLIPHGVDLEVFNPAIKSQFRQENGIPEDALMIISVGTICYFHKRMDYLIKEIAKVEGVYLVIVGQESVDSEEIKGLGKKLLGRRVKYMQIPNDELPKAYVAADIFALASLFETFGIVYIEAMAMKLPVIATHHINQKQIIRSGVFIDMSKPGELANAVRRLDSESMQKIGEKGRLVVEKYYDLNILKEKYIQFYNDINKKEVELRNYKLIDKLKNNINNFLSFVRPG